MTGVLQERMVPNGSPALGAQLRIRGLHVRGISNGTAAAIVHDLDLELAPGQTLGIVGESGSGKSLTAKSIIGLLPRTLTVGGSIVFDGTELAGAGEPELRRLRGTRIGLVMQDPFTMLHPLQTVATTIAESLLPQLRRDRRIRDEEIARRLTEVGIDPAVARKRTFELSGGMRQRIGIAAALAKDPELLIADEPTTALDVSTQKEVLELLQGIQRARGMSLILITHDLGVAFSICDRIAVMYAGRIVEQGPARSLAANPRHPYTLGLLAAAPPLTHVLERFRPIPGNVPPVGTVDHQCAFAARCDFAVEACRAAVPPLQPVGAEHEAACIRLEAVTRSAGTPAPDAVATDRAPASAAAAPPPIATAVALTKSFSVTGRRSGPRATVVDAVSFEIGAGEAVGLIGESGSGKSTIARCLTGLATPDSGQLLLGGRDISDYSRLSLGERRAAYRDVQLIFQDPYSSLNPKRTVGAALEEALAVAGGGPAEVPRLLETVGLPAGHALRRPHALSGGERQRVAIARALALQPRLLICDEPVAALDVSVQAQVLQVLRSVHESTGMSMLFITHDLAVVRQMTTRSIVLLQGEIVEQGPTAALLDDPRHPYTRRLRDAAQL